MATETQESAKLAQLAHENPDEIEVAAGREREQLEGWIPTLASDAEIREALEKAFDYRGDVTITRKDGSQVVGYLFDRRSGSSLALTGRDTEACKTFEAWVKKYWEKKAAGEKNIEIEPEKLD